MASSGSHSEASQSVHPSETLSPPNKPHPSIPAISSASDLVDLLGRSQPVQSVEDAVLAEMSAFSAHLRCVAQLKEPAAPLPPKLQKLLSEPISSKLEGTERLKSSSPILLEDQGNSEERLTEEVEGPRISVGPIRGTNFINDHLVLHAEVDRYEQAKQAKNIESGSGGLQVPEARKPVLLSSFQESLAGMQPAGSRWHEEISADFKLKEKELAISSSSALASPEFRSCTIAVTESRTGPRPGPIRQEHGAEHSAGTKECESNGNLASCFSEETRLQGADGGEALDTFMPREDRKEGGLGFSKLVEAETWLVNPAEKLWGTQDSGASLKATSAAERAFAKGAVRSISADQALCKTGCSAAALPLDAYMYGQGNGNVLDEEEGKQWEHESKLQEQNFEAKEGEVRLEVATHGGLLLAEKELCGCVHVCGESSHGRGVFEEASGMEHGIQDVNMAEIEQPAQGETVSKQQFAEGNMPCRQELSEVDWNGGSETRGLSSRDGARKGKAGSAENVQGTVDKATAWQNASHDHDQSGSMKGTSSKTRWPLAKQDKQMISSGKVKFPVMVQHRKASTGEAASSGHGSSGLARWPSTEQQKKVASGDAVKTSTLGILLAEMHKYRDEGVKVVEDGKRVVYYCTLCGVWAHSDNNLSDHLSGKKHLRQLAASGGTEGSPPGGSPDFVASPWRQTAPGDSAPTDEGSKHGPFFPMADSVSGQFVKLRPVAALSQPGWPKGYWSQVPTKVTIAPPVDLPPSLKAGRRRRKQGKAEIIELDDSTDEGTRKRHKGEASGRGHTQGGMDEGTESDLAPEPDENASLASADWMRYAISRSRKEMLAQGESTRGKATGKNDLARTRRGDQERVNEEMDGTIVGKHAKGKLYSIVKSSTEGKNSAKRISKTGRGKKGSEKAATRKGAAVRSMKESREAEMAEAARGGQLSNGKKKRTRKRAARVADFEKGNRGMILLIEDGVTVDHGQRKQIRSTQNWSLEILPAKHEDSAEDSRGFKDGKLVVREGEMKPSRDHSETHKYALMLFKYDQMVGRGGNWTVSALHQTQVGTAEQEQVTVKLAGISCITAQESPQGKEVKKQAESQPACQKAGTEGKANEGPSQDKVLFHQPCQPIVAGQHTGSPCRDQAGNGQVSGAPYIEGSTENAEKSTRTGAVGMDELSGPDSTDGVRGQSKKSSDLSVKGRRSSKGQSKGKVQGTSTEPGKEFRGGKKGGAKGKTPRSIERNCFICRKAMKPAAEVAALLNVTSGQLACSSRNKQGMFHVFHSRCLSEWVILCQAKAKNQPLPTIPSPSELSPSQLATTRATPKSDSCASQPTKSSPLALQLVPYKASSASSPSSMAPPFMSQGVTSEPAAFKTIHSSSAALPLDPTKIGPAVPLPLLAPLAPGDAPASSDVTESDGEGHLRNRESWALVGVQDALHDRDEKGHEATGALVPFENTLKGPFCPECQGTGVSLEESNGELERPRYRLSQVYEWMVELAQARRAWAESKERPCPSVAPMAVHATSLNTPVHGGSL